MRWTGRDGSRYVIGHDVRLLDLSAFTASLTIGNAGRAALLQSDGRLLAPPHDDRFASTDAIKAAVLKTPAELGLKDIEQGLATWKGNGAVANGIGNFVLDGNPWFSLFRPVSAGDQQFWLGVFAPEDEFLPTNRDNLLILAGIALLALLAGVVISFRIARQFGSPLARLAKESARIGRMELDAPVDVDAPWWEIQRLADAQETMRLRLKDASAVLESEVVERTRELRESQAALTEREAFFRAIFEHAAIGISSLTPELKRQRVNRAFCEFTGYTEAQLLAGTGLDLIAPPDRDRVRAAYKDLAAGLRQSFRTEAGMVHCDGSLRWADIQLTAIRESGGGTDGKVVSLLATILDVSERKTMEDELERQFALMQALLNTIPNPIFYKGADARFLGCNRAYEEAFGTSLHHFVGKRVLDLDYLSDADRQTYQAEDESVIAGAGRIAREVPMVFADGQTHDTLYSVTGFANHDGTPAGLVGLIVDITALKNAEREAQQARAAAEAAAAAKADFLANMSHEIRTPMNAIIGLTHIALQTELTSRQRNYLAKVETASKSLLGIINDILDFSKIEAGMMTIESVDFSLDQVLRHVADLSMHKAEDKGLELLFDIAADIPDRLIGDPLRLEQVLMNLVGNALKFTEHGEVTVAVSLVVADAVGLRLRFDVRDTGIGMADESRQRLFAPFSQADTSTTRRYGGTGLGLSICRRLVDLMGGKIDVASTLGQGSCFTFEIQLGRGALPEAAPEQVAMRGLRVLVADDSRGAREILTHLLTVLGFVPHAVTSGDEAIAEALAAQERGDPYALVIADWQMPEMDGVDTIRRIRAGCPVIATILMTGVDDHGRLPDVLGHAEIGAFLAKPATPSVLFDAIAEALHPGTRPTARRPERGRVPAILNGKRVLLVEDNEVNREMAEEILRTAGMQVETAVNGADAVERAAAAPYDVIIMDCHMPVMDGFEATRRIRANPARSTVPILAMTASVLLGDRELCIAAGMDDHIAKPVDVAQLYAKLAGWIEGKPVAVPYVDPPVTGGDAEPGRVVDRKAALARLGGNEDMYRRLLVGFRENQADAVERIRTALAAPDLDAARRDAHTLKGLAGNIGAADLVRAAAEVEQRIAMHGDADAIEAGMAPLEAELGRVVATIDGAPLPGRSTTATLAQTSAQALPAAVAGLHRLLVADDAEAVHRLDDILPQLIERLPADDVESLVRAVGRYQFENAVGLLRQFAAKLGITLD
jgi:PAS domain S-box-containing protein